MTSLTPKLAASHIIGLIVWMENAQNFFGLLGAVVGLFSAVMLVCINWDKFIASRPVAVLRRIFTRNRNS